MNDWLDIEEPGQLVVASQPVPAVSGDPIARIREFDTAWAKLSVKQQAFLVQLQANGFNARRACRAMGDAAPNQTTTWKWPKNDPDYAIALRIMKQDATADVLERERLILRQDEMVESLMTPKPILHQGLPVFDPSDPERKAILMEVEAAAAAKVNETLLRVGGHLRDEQEKAAIVGPALIVQVTSRESGDVVQVTAVGVTPQLPPPSWLDE